MDIFSAMDVSTLPQSGESVYSLTASGKYHKPKHYVKHTQISDLPDPILTNILTLISDVRTRNSMALVCNDWYKIERATRSSLCLRGNICDLHLIPRCFYVVDALDLSLCSPWGYSLFQSAPRGLLIWQLLKQAFPRVRYLTVYVRDARDIDMAAYLWPELESIKLIRWHQRAMQPEEAVGLGMEFRFLMQNCKMLKHVDLSEFYCWTEDIPPAMEVEPVVSSNLRSLNLLKVSPEGFKTAEMEAITVACRNLEELQMICVFDPRCLDSIADEGLLILANNCPRLRVLHLIDYNAFGDLRGDPNDGFSSQDSPITKHGLEGLFQSLTLLEDLVFVLAQNLRNAGPALDSLSTHCKNLRSLKLGNFHSICSGTQLDGITLCSALTKLAIRDCADLTDIGLAMIGRGCPRLRKLALCSCKEISAVGLRACAQHLCRTLVDVEVSCCLLLDAASTLWALEPIQSSIQHLHIDCVWTKDLLKEEAKAQLLCRASTARALTSRDAGISSGFDTAPGQRNISETGAIVNSVAAMPGHNSFASGVQCMGVGSSQHSIGTASNLDLQLSLAGTSVNFKGMDSGSPQSEALVNDIFFEGWNTSDSKTASDYVHVNCKGAIATSELGSLMTLGWGEYVNREQAGGSDNNCGSITNDGIFKPEEEDLVLPSSSGSQSLAIFKENLSLTMNGCSTGYVDEPVDFKDSPRTCSNNDVSVSQLLGCLENAKRDESVAVSDIPGSFSVPGIMRVESSEASVDCSIYGSGVKGDLGLEDGLDNVSSSFRTKSWNCLSSLSLWIPVGELIDPLPIVGLQYCPSLKEVMIRVQGDFRHCPKPRMRTCGLSALACYPLLSKLVLDCSEAVGFALSAPAGHMDLSLWERWYLMGIQLINISELDYWPPQDKEMNQRGLTLPSAGLLSQCVNLRKLIIHGTAHEHFMLMLLRIPNLRDVQLRADYYPAPEDELSTEMRTDSCKRFEAALANRGFPD